MKIILKSLFFFWSGVSTSGELIFMNINFKNFANMRISWNRANHENFCSSIPHHQFRNLASKSNKIKKSLEYNEVKGCVELIQNDLIWPNFAKIKGAKKELSEWKTSYRHRCTIFYFNHSKGSWRRSTKKHTKNDETGLAWTDYETAVKTSS